MDFVGELLIVFSTKVNLLWLLNLIVLIHVAFAEGNGQEP